MVRKFNHVLFITVESGLGHTSRIYILQLVRSQSVSGVKKSLESYQKYEVSYIWHCLAAGLAEEAGAANVK